MPVTLIKSSWTSGSLQFLQTASAGDAAVNFGEDDTGVDVKMFGATSGSYALWDQSADELVLNAAQLNFSGGTGTSAIIELTGTASHMFSATATKYGGIIVSADGMSQDPQTVSEDGYISFLVGASTYQIPIYLNT